MEAFSHSLLDNEKERRGRRHDIRTQDSQAIASHHYTNTACAVPYNVFSWQVTLSLLTVVFSVISFPQANAFSPRFVR